MTDAVLAASILAKLTGWYPFDNSLADVHGDNTMSEVVSVTYEAGPRGTQAAPGSHAVHTLDTAVPVTTTTGQFTIGGWFEWVSELGDAKPAFGFDFGPFAGTEAFKILVDHEFGLFLGTWGTGGIGYNVSDPAPASTYHPVTFRAFDSIGQHDDSPQVIRVERPGDFVEGFYFVVGTWDNGFRTLYIDSVNVKTEPPPGSVNQPTMPWITLGRVYNTPDGTNVGCNDCFFCTDAVLTQEEITYLYNQGAGKTYAQLQADAAG